MAAVPENRDETMANWPVIRRFAEIVRSLRHIMDHTESLARIPVGNERDQLMSLLLLADESEEQVRSYYQEGDLYALRSATGETLGMTLVLPDHDHAVELKAVAVNPDLHGQGIGQRMLARVLADLRRRGVPRAIVGTSNSGIGQIAFYQKAGFRLWKIERDFFTPARGYPAYFEENGIRLLDMVWFDQDLS
jgi:ribosomal protein S18 acetylase RimI-like enzyme